MKAVLCDNCLKPKEISADANFDGWISVSVQNKAAHDRAVSGMGIGALFGQAAPEQAAEPPPRSEIGPWDLCSVECAVVFMRNGYRSIVEIAATP